MAGTIFHISLDIGLGWYFDKYLIGFWGENIWWIYWIVIFLRKGDKSWDPDKLASGVSQ